MNSFDYSIGFLVKYNYVHQMPAYRIGFYVINCIDHKLGLMQTAYIVYRKPPLILLCVRYYLNKRDARVVKRRNAIITSYTLFFSLLILFLLFFLIFLNIL